MQSLIKYSRKLGWVCAGPIVCRFCAVQSIEGHKVWQVKSINSFVCDNCFIEKRAKGELRTLGTATPVTVLNELPREEDFHGKDW